ncbi:hypothetical protein Q5752_004560 [Cryptotrichosporon argae]
MSSTQSTTVWGALPGRDVSGSPTSADPYPLPTKIDQAHMDYAWVTLIGTELSLVFTGLVLGVTWCYFRYFRDESKWRRAFVAAAAALCVVESVLAASKVARWVGVYGGGRLALTSLTTFPETWSQLLIAFIVGSLCEVFMVVRILRFAHAMMLLHGRRYAACVWAMTAVFVLGVFYNATIGAIAVPVVFATHQSFFQLSAVGNSGSGPLVELAANANLGGTVTMDVLVTLASGIQYRMARTGFGASTSVLDKLTIVLVRSGAFVTLVQVTQLIANKASPTMYGLLPIYVLPRIRVLTALAIITTPRDALDAFYARQGAGADVDIDVDVSMARTRGTVTELRDLSGFTSTFETSTGTASGSTAKHVEAAPPWSDAAAPRLVVGYGTHVGTRTSVSSRHATALATPPLGTLSGQRDSELEDNEDDNEMSFADMLRRVP